MALGKLILIGGVALIAWWVIGRPTSIEELRADIDNITAQFKGQDAQAAAPPTDPNSIDNTNTQDNTADDGSGGGQDPGGDQGQQDDGSGGGGFGGGGGRHRGGFGGGGGQGGQDQGGDQQDDGSGGDQGGDDGSDFAPSIGGGGSQSGDTTSIPTQSSTPFSDGGSAHDSGDDGSDFGGDFGGGGDQQDDGSITPDQTAVTAPPPSHHHQHLTKAQRDVQAAIAAKGKKPPHPQAVQAKDKHEYSGHGKYKGTPGFYTVHGHHHCFEGDAGCKCTDCHKCNCHGPVGNGTHHTPPHAVLKTQAPITQKQHAKQHNHPNLIAHKNSQHVKVSQTSHGGNNFLSTKTVNGKTVVTTNNPKHTKIVSNHPVHVVHQHHPVVHHKKKKKKVVHHSNLAYTLGYDGGFHYLESSPLSILYNGDY